MRPAARHRLRSAVVVGAAALLAAPAAASAHIQVTPAQAAPGDPVLFQLLVPNERSERTVEVALKVPAGLLPFSFEETPGWTRTETKAEDGSIGVVRWKGRLDAETFVRFAFLASTPPKAGELSWKATQTYADGDVVRWIGAPGSEEPAAVTRISASAPRQNAGGEGDEDASGGPAGGAAQSGSATGTSDDGTSGGLAGAAVVADGGRDTLTLVLAIAGVVLAAGALGVAVLGRRA